MKKTVLVTGAAGYIGRHVCLALLNAGYYVVGTDYTLESGAWEFAKGFGLKFQTISPVDIENAFGVESLFALHARTVKKKKPFYAVVHLAALTSVPESEIKFADYIATNLLGTANLVQAANQFGVSKFVFASSAAVYAAERGGVRENTSASPDNFYGSTKILGEAVIFGKFKGKAHALRLFNVAGVNKDLGRPVQKGLISLAVSCGLRGKKFAVHGDGSQVRDYIHVDDVSANFVAALESDFDKQVVNVGSGQPTSVIDVVDGLKAYGVSIQSYADSKHAPGVAVSFLNRQFCRNAGIATKGLKDILASEVAWQQGCGHVSKRKKSGTVR